MPQGSMPLYVGTVTYGMMAVMFMESNKSVSEMKSALEASYKGAVNVKINANYTAKEVLDTSKLKIQVYGGSTLGLDNIETGFGGFMEVLRASKTYSPDSPGVPISYVFRNLQDNLLTAVTQTAQYNLSTPIKIATNVTVEIIEMICTNSDDEGAGNDADMDRFTINIGGQSAKRDGTLTQQTGVTLYNWASPGEVTTPVGHVWTDAIGKKATVRFDTDPNQFDFNKAVMSISAYAREHDSSGADEDGSGGATPIGPAMLGEQTFTIDSSDFQWRVKVRITKD